MSDNLVGRFTTGGLIVLIGALLLLTTTDVIEVTTVWEWVQLIFALLGVWALVGTRFRNLVGPVMVIAIAGAYFLRNIGVLPDDVISTWWPLFVVLFGVLLVFNRFRRRQRTRLEGGGTATETVVVALFSTDGRRLQTDQFTGGEIFSFFFGSATIDLRDADVRAKPAVIEVISVFSDAEIRVPPEWDVQRETLNLLGDTTDRRPTPDEPRPSDEQHISSSPASPCSLISTSATELRRMDTSTHAGVSKRAHPCSDERSSQSSPAIRITSFPVIPRR